MDRGPSQMVDEAVREFLIESCEALDLLDRELLALEKAPSSKNTLSSLFRAIHTIKGTAGCLGLSAIESLSHAGENLLVRARDGELLLTPPRIDGLLAMSDALRALLSSLEAGRDDGGVDQGATIERLTALAQEKIEPQGPQPVVANSPGAANEVQPAPANLEGQALAAEGSSLRVDVGLLDRLMNLIGELVLSRNQILQVRARLDDPGLNATSQRLNSITSQLQAIVMKTRMQPIGNVWSKLPRAVRDTAASLGKQAQLVLQGAETELDKTLLEAIKDPLTHLVRNAVDHGIEAPEVRAARGKPREGRIELKAWHEGGQVNLVLSDDGAGIEPGKLKAKAVAKGFLAADKAAKLSDREALALIFLPGFSTADKVSAVSGRGVGMDVVRTNVERIGGTVDVQSTPGAGTVFKIKIPLTLAIVPALIVGCGGERYAVPQLSLLEIVRLDRAQAERSVERIHDAQLFRLRGRLLPIVDLREVLGLAAAKERANLHVIVLQADGQKLGLLVDSIEDTVEIVVKPLGRHLKGVPLFAGATILGDGRTALIVDVRALAQSARLVDERHAAGAREPAPAEVESDRRAFLLCRASDQGRMAIPLGQVARLEEIAAGSIELVGGREVVQHRGDILPLVRISQALPERRTGERSVHAAQRKPEENLQVIVHDADGASVGLVVDSIDDILEASPHARRAATRHGVDYVAVIGDRITEVLDVGALCLAASQQALRELP